MLTLFYYVFKSSPGGFTKCAQSSLNFHLKAFKIVCTLARLLENSPVPGYNLPRYYADADNFRADYTRPVPSPFPPSIDIYYLSILTSFLRSSTFVFLSIRVTSWNWNIYICVKRQDWSEDLKFLVLYSTSPIFWLRVVSDRPKEVIKIDILGETFTYEFTLLFISLPFQEVYMYMYRYFFSARQIVRNSKNKPASLHLL